MINWTSVYESNEDSPGRALGFLAGLLVFPEAMTEIDDVW